MNAFNFSTVMTDGQKNSPLSTLWSFDAGREVASGDSNLFNTTIAGWALPSPSHSDNNTFSDYGVSLKEDFRPLSTSGSQGDKFEFGEGPMDAERCNAFSIEEILKKGLLKSFAKDPRGSRHLQTVYPAADTEERLMIAVEIFAAHDVFMNLACDAVANYFIQHFIEQATSMEQVYVANSLRSRMFQLSLDKHSCRVVQKALDVLPQELTLELISELQYSNIVLLCVDQHANYVIQKIMNEFPVRMWSFLIETFLHDELNLFRIAEDRFGFRIVQQAVELLAVDSKRNHQSNVLLKRIMTVIIENCMRLALNEFSNYIVQFIIEYKPLSQYRDMIIENCILRNLLSMGQEKYASHVVEKAMKHAPNELLREMMDEIFDGYEPQPETNMDALDILMFHQFGNYIVQRMLNICVQAAHVRRAGGNMDDMSQRLTWLRRLSERITTNEARLVRYSSGRKIIGMISEVSPMLLGRDTNNADLMRTGAVYVVRIASAY